METALLKSKSKADLVLLLKLAAKLNIEGKLLSEDELEDAGMHHAIKKGRTGKYIDKDKFINKLQGK
jgi:hypothetical protein